MQADRTADVSRLAGSVRGLGVCDVLRAEFAACQHASFERELEQRRAVVAQRIGALETGERSRTRLVRPRTDEVSPPLPELAELHVESSVLARIHENAPRHVATAFVVTGPAGLVLEIVEACLKRTLTELVETLGRTCDEPSARTAQLEAAGAWIASALDCRAVETFSFEPGIDPVHAR